MIWPPLGAVHTCASQALKVPLLQVRMLRVAVRHSGECAASAQLHHVLSLPCDATLDMTQQQQQPLWDGGQAGRA